MDNNIKILLNSYKNITSVNKDINTKIELSNVPIEINEYDLNNAVNASLVFDSERQGTPIYRIYGRIEYMSILNGLKNDYLNFKDFFLPKKSESKSILNSFKFYLVKPANIPYSGITGNTWQRFFEVIATPENFDIYPASYSTNVYGEQIYTFNFNIDLDISNYDDYFNFPLTELFIYAQYIPKYASAGIIEKLSGTTWNSNRISSLFEFTPNYSFSDIVQTQNIKIGDLINYNKSEYLQTLNTSQTFYISTPYRDIPQPPSMTNTLHRLIWKYNPLIPLQLRYLSDSLYQANTGNTQYDVVNSIPSFATLIDNNGNYVWRDIVSEGYIDPLSGKGNDVPFVNNRRYFFTSIILDIVPDLGDEHTREMFSEIWYTRNPITNYTTPTGDINNFGKPCK